MTTAELELVCPPQWLHVPEHVTTYGSEVADLAATAGMPLDPEQRLLPDACYAVDEQDRRVATEVGCSAARQNIKTHGGKACTLADLVLFRIPNQLWSAHRKETAYEAFRNPDGTGLADVFDSYDWLRRLVEEIRDSDGEVSITLRAKRAGDPRPKVRFATRSDGGGGRGLTGEVVTFDEALFLKAAHTAAMIPVLSARSMAGRVQVRYLGSPGLKSSQVWRDIRDRGRAGNARALAWIEFAASREPLVCESPQCSHQRGFAGCALDREDLIRAANLSIDRRMDIRYVMETERDALTPEDFMRERMGMWDDPPLGGGVLDLSAWANLAVGIQPMQSPTLSVEVALDRSVATIGAAWTVKGRPHVEVVEDHPGVGWVVPRLAELTKRYSASVVVLDAGTEAAGLTEAIEAAGLRVLKVGSPERVAACGGFYDATTAAGLTHNGDPALAAAIAAARWKDVGDGARVFTRRKSAGDIAALYAVVLALHGLISSPPVAVLNTIW